MYTKAAAGARYFLFIYAVTMLDVWLFFKNHFVTFILAPIATLNSLFCYMSESCTWHPGHVI